MANQRTYEVLFIIDPAASDEEATRLTENLQNIVVEQGGQITKSENMGRRALAYEINHQTEGIYVLFEIEGSGREISELERRMRVNDQIVRYLTVRVDEDRQRAEKFRARRAHRASKRPFAASAAAGGRSSSAVSITADDSDDGIKESETLTEEIENV